VPLVLAVLVLAPLAALADPIGPPNAMPLPTLVPAGPASVAGSWEAPFEGQIPAVHMALLPDQRVIYWSGDQAGNADWIYFLGTVQGSDTRLLAPPYTADTVTSTSDPDGVTTNLFCSGHTLLPDGRLLSAGGSTWHATVSEQDPSFVDGVAQARVFDWRTSTWSNVSPMEVARWYPTVMTTSQGGLAASGIVNLPEPQTMDLSMERFDGANWSFVPGGNDSLPLYPRLLEVPSGPLKGQLYYAVGGTLWGPFGERPEEPLWNVPQAYDPATQSWSYQTNLTVFGVRTSPDDVLLPLDPANGYDAKLLTFGGTLQRSVVATSTAELTDFATDPPTHTLAAPLATPRWQSTGVLLPDGKVLAVGGALYDNVMTYGTPDPAVMSAELYDPATDAWTTMASMTIPREYHGTALLLPDGRVLVGGHVPNPVPWKALRDNVGLANQSPQTKFEIFEPPYLHWGVPQPDLHEAPTRVGYGETFTVQSTDAAKVKDAIFVRHGAETHSSDPSTRAVVLPVLSRDGETLTFQAPPDAVLATPGPWMLFLREDVPGHGLIPSHALTLMLGADP
jgi:hypothetical protein